MKNTQDEHTEKRDCRIKNKIILIIDDSIVQTMALLRLFKGLDVNVLTAKDGEDGLKIAIRVEPDVILLDINMPGMNGFEVCHLLQYDERTKKIPIILFTTRTGIKDVSEGFANGAVEFIPKDGFHEAVLVETLRQMEVIS